MGGKESGNDVAKSLVDVLARFGAVRPKLLMQISRKFCSYNELVFPTIDFSR